MPAMPEPDQRIGRLVDDRYQILEAMAAGSMGAVYRAERVPVGKVVAIKFLHASFVNDSEFLIRFERETQVMSKLAHPNCVSVVDFGVWEESPYLVMDFVNGRTLRSIIDDAPLEIPRALSVARQIAAGLAHAHIQDVVHRDVKPANIMLSDEIGTGERVRILDFGLARLRSGGGRDATQTNVVVGTPNYMAPEQTIGGGTVDARTDIYAAGVVLFEMIAGEKPFQAEDTMQLLGMHRGAPIPRLADRMPAGTVLPVGLQEIIDTAMAKKPADRYQAAVDMAEAIADVLDTMIGGRPTGELRIPGSSPARMPRSPASVGVAPTMLDIGSQTHKTTPIRRAWKTPLLGALILVGGIAAGTGYLVRRGAADRVQAPLGSADAEALVEPTTNPKGSAAIGPVPTDARDRAETIAPDSAIGSAGSGSDGSGTTPAVGSAGSGSDTVVAVGSGSSGAGSDEDIDMDPAKAVDPNPNHESADAVDEASDAPATKEDVEKTAPVQAAPVLAKTIVEAVHQIKDGKRELAISSLRVLWKSSPKDAYIPFLLGNLYFDKMWWGVAMDHYRSAIGLNGGFRKNQILNQNIIRTLASTKTQKQARELLRWIGPPAVPFLKSAAAHDGNPIIKKQAALLAKSIR